MKRRSFLAMLGLGSLSFRDSGIEHRVAASWIRFHNRWMSTGGVRDLGSYTTTEALPNSVTVDWGDYSETTRYFKKNPELT